MKTFKRILTILFVIALLPALGVSAFAENGDTITRDGINYLESYENVPNHKIYIVTSSPDVKGDVVIPDEINGIPVRRIDGHAFQLNRFITSVTIGDNVSTIGNNAFDSCSEITKVTFGKSVYTIEHYAFHGCTSLTSVELGNAVTMVKTSAFGRCDALESVRFGIGLNYVSQSAFDGCNSLRTIALPDDMTLTLDGVSDELEFLPISSEIRMELEELKMQRSNIQQDLTTLEKEIDTLTAYLNRVDGTASVFGAGNMTLIIVGAVLIVAALVIGLLIGKKQQMRSVPRTIDKKIKQMEITEKGEEL